MNNNASKLAHNTPVSQLIASRATRSGLSLNLSSRIYRKLLAVEEGLSSG